MSFLNPDKDFCPGMYILGQAATNAKVSSVYNTSNISKTMKDTKKYAAILKTKSPPCNLQA